jgi:enamine deaminase RidA (YjgF/YER057c/UK114 family)
MDASKLVKVYIKMRDAKAALEHEMEEKVNAIAEQMAIVEQELLEICKATGQDGGKTEYGSFTRSVKTRYWTSDWDRMYAFIRDHDAPELLEKRIHQGNFKEFLEQHPGTMPEGVNVDSKYAITVRRSR